ncbi:MAG: hypothetical protein L0L10_02575 [Tetragenococcus sp.]|nr:hypothetical protein [Tetragenococcus sp.]
MEEIDQIKRKHARFPAFSDDTGVKTHSEKKHPPFSNDENWILTEERDVPLTKPVLKENKKKRGFRRSKKASQEKSGLTPQEQNELEEHRKHLSDYSPGQTKEKNSIFNRNRKRTTTGSQRPADSIKKESDRGSYFTPKYIPASMIPDKKEDKYSEKELLNSLKKSKDDYLLFDTTTTAFKDKKEKNYFQRK